MRRRHLRPQQSQLRIIQRNAQNRAEVSFEVGRCNGRDEGGYVGGRAVEGSNLGVVEIVAGGDGLNLGEGCVAGADDSDGAWGELRAGIDGGEPVAGLSGRGVSYGFGLWTRLLTVVLKL